MTTLHSEVTKFLSAQPLKMFIGGRWTGSVSGDTFKTRDPGKGTVLARVAASDAADIEQAVQAAHEAFRKSDWATMPRTRIAAINRRVGRESSRAASSGASPHHKKEAHEVRRSIFRVLVREGIVRLDNCAR